MGKKIYWAICILALVLSAYYAPKFVDYEWGIGAYIAVGWGVFLAIFGLVGFFAPQISKWIEKK